MVDYKVEWEDNKRTKRTLQKICNATETKTIVEK